MIYKCSKERNAVINNGMKVLLCEFHLVRRNTKFHCRRKKKTRFWQYFETYWLRDEWLESRIDSERPGNRIGLYNTNNHCEAFFKKILRVFLGGGESRSPTAVLEIVASNCILFYENATIQKNDGYTKPQSRRNCKTYFLNF